MDIKNNKPIEYNKKTEDRRIRKKEKDQKPNKERKFGRNKSVSDDDRLKKNIDFFSWVQEFSKKIVAVTFFIFVIANIFIMLMIIMEFRQTLEIYYIDTLISEVHCTFRDVIGGYIVKAAAENVFKIGGSYMESYMQYKTTSFTSTTVTKEVVNGGPDPNEGPTVVNHDLSEFDNSETVVRNDTSSAQG